MNRFSTYSPNRNIKMFKQDSLEMHSPNIIDDNTLKIAEIFPHCVTEARDDNGNLRYVVDFDLLRQELSQSLVEGGQERYRLDWPGKRQAILEANTPIAKTLRPVREESVNFDTTENLFIEGDNLEALKLLQESYLGQVKMIYIDPPYNTGNDFIYEDDFAEDTSDFLRLSEQVDEDGNRLVTNTESNGRFHSDWLTMMYSRLKLARNLLKDDGVIVVHIDENEYSNLDKLLHEIFGERNNLGTIIWDKRNPKGDSINVSSQHESIILFAKNREVFKQKNQLRQKKENAEKIISKATSLICQYGITVKTRTLFKNWIKSQSFSGGELAYNQIDEDGEVFQSVSMAWPNSKKAPDEYFTPLIHPLTKKPCPVPEKGWRNPPKRMKDLLNRNLIVFGSDETTQPRRKYLLKENFYENIPSLLYFGGRDNALEMPFENPKPLYVAKKLIEAVLNHDEIVLDFFAGSSTTAHAVMELNKSDNGSRKFIMIQIDEVIDHKSKAFKLGFSDIAELSRERIRRAGQKILEDNKDKESIEDLDIGFRVLKIDSTNMKEVYYTPDEYSQDQLENFESHIKEDRTSEDLLFQVMLDWGVPLSLPIEVKEIKDHLVYCVGFNSLIACFDTLTTELVNEIAKYEPLKFVTSERAISHDQDKTNIKSRFAQLSPNTDVRFI